MTITNAQTFDVITITLTAGDWDVSGSVYIDPTKTADLLAGWVTDVSATQPDGSRGGIMITSGNLANNVNGLITGFRRFNITTTTTIYLGGTVQLSGGSSQVSGFVHARRMR